MFRKLDLFPSSGKGRETSILWGPLERANLHHCSSSTPRITSHHQEHSRIDNTGHLTVCCNITSTSRTQSSGMLCHVGPSKKLCFRATWCNLPGDSILHSHRCENLKFYITSISISHLLGHTQWQEELVVEQSSRRWSLWVKSCCVCGAGIFQEPRKGNVCHGSWYHKTGEGQQTKRTVCMCMRACV
jgi:hypothetical protein